MRTILSLLILSISTFSFADLSNQVELKPFSMQVSAQTFKPVKAKAKGTISLNKCTSSKDKTLNLWCYQVDTKIKIAEVHQLAKFQNHNNSILPWYTQQNDRIFWKKTEKTTSFNHTNQSISTTYEKTDKQQNYTGDIYDGVSYVLQIRKLLISGQTKFKLNVVSGHKIKAISFKVIGKETLFTKAGILETIKIEQLSGNKKVIIWFAKRWDYLPVQFETYKSNKLRSRVTATSVNY